MKTSHLQSVLAHNASVITDKLLKARQARIEARGLKAFTEQTDRIKANRSILYKQAENYTRSVGKLALIQKDIKKELRHQEPEVAAIAIEGIGGA